MTSRWGVLALSALLERTYRFSELRRRIDGVSEKMLAQTLRNLEKDGFVSREAYPVIPPRVEYSLTTQGREAAELLSRMVAWLEAQMPAVLEQQRFRERGASSSSVVTEHTVARMPSSRQQPR